MKYVSDQPSNSPIINLSFKKNKIGILTVECENNQTNLTRRRTNVEGRIRTEMMTAFRKNKKQRKLKTVHLTKPAKTSEQLDQKQWKEIETMLVLDVDWARNLLKRSVGGRDRMTDEWWMEKKHKQKSWGCWCRRYQSSKYLFKQTHLAAIYTHSAATQRTTTDTSAIHDLNHLQGLIPLKTTVKMPNMTLVIS